MKVTTFTRKVLASRREDRDMKKQGFKKHETDWEIHRGSRTDERIVDVRISVCGKYVFTKIGKTTP